MVVSHEEPGIRVFFEALDGNQKPVAAVAADGGYGGVLAAQNRFWTGGVNAVGCYDEMAADFVSVLEDNGWFGGILCTTVLEPSAASRPIVLPFPFLFLSLFLMPLHRFFLSFNIFIYLLQSLFCSIFGFLFSFLPVPFLYTARSIDVHSF